MDSTCPPARVEHHPSPGGPPERGQIVEVTPPPPPRQPLRRCWTDTDPVPRPCPPPPLPARRPLGRSPHHVGSTADLPASNLPRPVHQQAASTALDSVVPLSHWPLRCAGSPTMVDKPQTSTRVSLNECGRRAGGAGGLMSIPVTVMVVSPTPSVNHSTPIATSPAPHVPKLCSNGRCNLYVDSPTLNRSGGVVSSTTQQPSHHRLPTGTDCRDGLLHPPTSGVVCPPPSHTPSVKFNPVVQTSTGGSGPEKLGAVVATQPRSSDDSRTCRGGIMCQRCGRCRCANCTAPRELPRRWVGDCECSVQRCVSVTSCLCCVEALFYHCLDGSDADDGGGAGASDDPCACCERPRCCLRWSIMAGLAGTVLPCLCCYCPLQCAADALTACYNTCATPRGCRCRTSTQEASSGSSTRGLLAESESSST